MAWGMLGMPTCSWKSASHLCNSGLQRRRESHAKATYLRRRPTPWFQGWRPATDPLCGVTPPRAPYKPWLRPRAYDKEHGLRLTSYSYMPTNMLYHVLSLGGAEAFLARLSHVEHCVNGVPDIPWDRIVPKNPTGLRFANEVHYCSRTVLEPK